MDARDSQWYVRWFLWNCRVLDRFLPRVGCREFRYERGTNLCHFFRTLLFGSIVVVSSVAVWMFTAWTVLIMPWIVFDAARLVGVIAIVAVACGAFVAIVAGACSAPVAVKWVSSKAQKVLVNNKGNPSFFAVVASYLSGVKNRFCPTIRFVKEDGR